MPLLPSKRRAHREKQEATREAIEAAAKNAADLLTVTNMLADREGRARVGAVLGDAATMLLWYRDRPAPLSLMTSADEVVAELGALTRLVASVVPVSAHLSPMEEGTLAELASHCLQDGVNEFRSALRDRLAANGLRRMDLPALQDAAVAWVELARIAASGEPDEKVAEFETAIRAAGNVEAVLDVLTDPTLALPHAGADAPHTRAAQQLVADLALSRQMSGRTRTQVEDVSGISGGHLYDLERRGAGVSVHTAAQVATAVGSNLVVRVGDRAVEARRADTLVDDVRKALDTATETCGQTERSVAAYIGRDAILGFDWYDLRDLREGRVELSATLASAWGAAIGSPVTFEVVSPYREAVATSGRGGRLTSYPRVVEHHSTGGPGQPKGRQHGASDPRAHQERSGARSRVVPG